MNADERRSKTENLSALICVYRRLKLVFLHPARMNQERFSSALL